MPGSNKSVHTVWREPNWVNIVEGDKSPLSMHASQDEAIAHGRALARSAKVEHVIHRPDHTIRERNSYGGDPRDVPG